MRSHARPWIDSGQERGCRGRLHHRADRRPRDQAACRRGLARKSRAGDRRDPRRSHRRQRRGGRGRRRRGEGPDDRNRHPRDQQAARTGGTRSTLGRVQSRPPLAQRAHAYAARSRALEIFPCRQPRCSTASRRRGTPGAERCASSLLETDSSMSAALARRSRAEPVVEFQRARRCARRPPDVIRDDAEAIAVAAEARRRDRRSDAVRAIASACCPIEELDLISDAGLLAITVPQGLRRRRRARRNRRRGDRDALARRRLDRPDPAEPFLHARGACACRARRSRSASSTAAFSPASGSATRSPRSAPRPRRITRRALTRDGAVYRLNGRKFYSTGVLFAHWVAVVANDDDQRLDRSPSCRATPRGSRSSTTGRASASASRARARRCSRMSRCIRFAILSFARAVRAADVDGPVRADHARGGRGGHRPRRRSPKPSRFVRTRARPWKDAGVDRAHDDPYTIAQVGELKIRVAGFRRAARTRRPVRRRRRRRAFRRDRSPRLRSRSPRPRSPRPRPRCTSPAS